MLESLRRLIGSIVVTETNGVIDISGLPTYFVTEDMYKQWGTARIAMNMFIRLTKNRLSFHSFFAPDFVYTLQTLLGRKRSRINRRAVEEVIKQMYLKTWLKNTQVTPNSKFNYDNLKYINVPLKPHQDEFLKQYDVMTQQYGLKGYLLAAAPGSGKTLIDLAVSLVAESDVVVMIVPKNSVDRVWVATVENMLTCKRKCWSSTGDAPLEFGYSHYIFHYEQLDKALEFFGKTASRYKKPIVVLDECHNFNDLKSQRTLDFIDLCKILNAPDIVWASGTPVKAMGGEVIPMLRTLDPLFTPEVEERFKKIFGVSVGRGLDILRNRLGFMSFKVDKQEVVGNQVEIQRVDVTMPNGKDYTLETIKQVMAAFIEERWGYYEEHMKEFLAQYWAGIEYHAKTLRSKADKDEFQVYQDTAKLFHNGLEPKYAPFESMLCNKYEKNKIIPFLPPNLKEDFKNAKSVYKYCYLKIQGEALGRILGKQRSQCNVDMVRNMNKLFITEGGEETSLFEIIEDSKKKTIIFTSFVEVVDEAFDYLTENGFKPVKVYGATNKDLPSIISAFEKDPDLNPLIATFQSLSTAVPLVMANSVIMANSPFRPHEHEQALSRVDRIGQTEIVYCYNVFLKTGNEPNISTRSNDILAWAQSQVEQITGKSGIADIAALESMSAEESIGMALEAIDLILDEKEDFAPIQPVWITW